MNMEQVAEELHLLQHWAQPGKFLNNPLWAKGAVMPYSGIPEKARAQRYRVLGVPVGAALIWQTGCFLGFPRKWT